MRVLALFLVLVFPAVSAAARQPRSGGHPGRDRFIPNLKPVLTITPTEGRITVDGNLDDSGWVGAARAANFTETSPGDQVRPPLETEVFVTYDEARLYIAFIAHDDPLHIRASLRARDEIFDDDHVGVVIDTYSNAAWAYELFANPMGIQGDRRWTPSGEDVGFDVVFESRGRITERGYQVEMAVPFKSLRFPDRDAQSWRVTFTRIHPRDSRRRYTWATISRDDPCFPCQFGTLTGIHDVSPGSSVEVMPTLVGSQSGALRDFADPGSGFGGADSEAEASVGLRYSLTSSVAAEATVNPDFSQVESDVAQIDINTTFALFFPERRPFFQEGSDLFRTPWNVVYTRTINDPIVAGKVTGRTEKTSFVALAARDEHSPLILPLEERSQILEAGRSTSGIFRVQRTLRDDSNIGAVATVRRYDGGGFGGVAGIDGVLRFKRNYRLKAQEILSLTHEPNRPNLTTGADTFDRGKHTVTLDGESFTGHGAFLGLERDTRHWRSNVDYWDSSPTFRADNGFVFRNSERRLAWANAYTIYRDNRWFDEFQPHNVVTRRWNATGTFKSQSIENWFEVQFKRQTRVTLGYDFNKEYFRGVYFDDMRLAYGEVNTAFSGPMHFGFWVGIGDRIARTTNPPALGEGVHVDAWATIKPHQRLTIEPVLTYSSLSRKDTGEEVFDAYILRARFNYQCTREVFVRLVTQYDDFSGELNVEPLLTYQLNPFSVFYIGGSSNYQDYGHGSIAPAAGLPRSFEPVGWQVFFKFQYFYRI